MQERIQLVGFDGDDTLWRSEDYYRAAQAEFEQIVAAYLDLAEVHDCLYAVEKRNLALFGYGAKGMTLSMLEAAISTTGGRIAATDLQRILDIGKSLLCHPVELLPGIRDAVAAIAEMHDVVLITKGDLFHQEANTRDSCRDAIRGNLLKYKTTRRFRARKRTAKCGQMWSCVRRNRPCIATIMEAA